jgi:hypothetical protein
MDPHLRDTTNLLGYEVWSTGRRVGILSDFIMEPTSWHIKYLSVKVGDWVYHEGRFVPTLSVQSISWGTHRVTLNGESLVRSHSLPRSQDSQPSTRHENSGGHLRYRSHHDIMRACCWWLAAVV